MEFVEVPFLKKAQVLSLGGGFDRISRKWFIPDALDPEAVKQIRELCSIFDINNPMQKQEKEEKQFYVNSVFPANFTSLQAADYVFQHGLPEDTGERIKILKALGQRTKNNYPIEYDGMLCCEDFAKRYPPEKLTALCVGKITGNAKLDDEIDRLDISEEEKALLHFALPC